MTTKPRKIKPEKLVVVEWQDPSTESGWVSREEALAKDSGALMVTVGWFVGVNNQDELVLSGDWCYEDSNVNTVMRIKRGTIVRMREMRPPGGLKAYPPKEEENGPESSIESKGRAGAGEKEDCPV